MKEESLRSLQDINERLQENIRNYEYVKVQIQAQEANAVLKESLHQEENVEKQMLLLGIAQTIEDIILRLKNGETDAAELYAQVHLPSLLEKLDMSDKERIKILIDALNQVKKEIESNRAMKEQIATPEQFIFRYKNEVDEEIKEIVDYVKATNKLEIFNYDYTRKYEDITIDVYYDDEANMNYIFYMGEKKMYFPTGYSAEKIKQYVKGILCEQDERSPHHYGKAGYEVQEGDIAVDAGVAEGNFALSVIDKVKKIYLIECEKQWVVALRKTFEPYQEKVVIVEKFLSNRTDGANITLDKLLGDEEVNYIKMDIEGAERDALLGAANSIERSSSLKAAICAYHKRGDEEWIEDYFRKKGLVTEPSRGYMYFQIDPKAMVSLELRRGIVFGKKQKL